MSARLDGPPSPEQIDALGELFVDREHHFTLETLAAKCTTRLDAGFMLRHLRDCPRRES